MENSTSAAEKSLRAFLRTSPIVTGLLLFIPALVLAAQAAHYNLQDASDWWSVLNEYHSRTVLKLRLPTPSADLKILGVGIGENQFHELAERFGEAPVITRGDADTGRKQVCYMSPDENERVYVAFEEGPMSHAFYLFKSRRPWAGAEYCMATKEISPGVEAASGVHLGQSQREVLEILGQPSLIDEDRLVFNRGTQEHTPEDQLQQFRKQMPGLNEQQVRELFGSFNRTVFMEARFLDRKLSYLAVAETTQF
jgi:hypothetical protein